MRYGVVDFDTAPVTPEHRVHYFTQAPSVFFGHTPVQMAVGVLVPAAAAALVYALLAVSTVRDDLGAYPPEEPLRPAAADRHSGRRLTTRPVSTRAATVPSRHMPR